MITFICIKNMAGGMYRIAFVIIMCIQTCKYIYNMYIYIHTYIHTYTSSINAFSKAVLFESELHTLQLFEL